MWLYLIGFIIVLFVVAFSLFAIWSDLTIMYILAFIMLSICLIVSGGLLTWICVMIAIAITLALTKE